MPIIYTDSDTKPAPHPWQLFMLFIFLAIGAKEMSSTHCGVLLFKKKQPFCKGVPFSRAKALV